MGSLNFSLNDFYDQTTEFIGIKSGLLLSKHQMNTILKEEFNDPFLNSKNEKRYIRIRSEEFSIMLRHIRVRIGNLPSEDRYVIYRNIVGKCLRKNEEALLEYNKLGLWAVKEFMTKKALSFKTLKHTISVSRTIRNEEIIEAMTHLIMYNIDDILLFPESNQVNGMKELTNLFKKEVIPVDDNTFLDQQFLDYLAVNDSQIEMVHWRNFERFCAQYLKKKGFNVKLGPGSNDGGIDIRVFNDTKGNTDPFILIQCKRYSSERKVAIETVKAFYSDVIYENAQHGLIATTSEIAEGGKKIVKVRQYDNISFAEKGNIKKWAKELWKYDTSFKIVHVP